MSRNILAVVALIPGWLQMPTPASAQLGPNRGEAFVWGSRAAARSGDGHDAASRSGARADGLDSVVAVAGCGDKSLAVTPDGAVWEWGGPVPVQVSGIRSVTAVACGAAHDLALRLDGTAWTWGPAAHAPAKVAGITNATGIAAGAYHSLALTADGTAWAWGGNFHGELGNGSDVSSAVPVRVSRISRVIAVSGGAAHSMAVDSAGTVWTWGDNSYGQLGDGTDTASNVPVRVSGLTGIVAVAAGAHHSLALKADGTVWAWGENRHGELGDGSGTNRSRPQQVASLSGVTAVVAGSSHSLALKADGTVWAWGDNTYGQLGDPARTNSFIAVQVPNLSGTAVAIASGPAALHSLAIVTHTAGVSQTKTPAPGGQTMNGGRLAAAAQPGAQAVSASSYTYNISTVAGNGSTNSSGDNGQAALAGIAVNGMARDASGNLYITDDGTSTSGIRVRKVNAAGIITTLVNSATTGCQAPAGGFCVLHAGGITVDHSGSVYFSYSDGGPEAVVKLDTTGKVSFFAGSHGGFSGDGGPAQSAMVEPGDGGMTFDTAGNFYLADSGNDRIRKITPAGIITTVAGNGVHGFSGDGGPATLAALSDPSAVALDAAGNLYIADRNNNRVRKVDTSGIITTVAGGGYGGFNGYSGDGGPATAAQMQSPSGVAVDSAGRLFISDSYTVIRMVDTSGYITTIAGTAGSPGFAGDGGTATSAQLTNPGSLALGDGNSIYFADIVNNRVRLLTVACTFNLAGVINIAGNVNNVGESFSDAGGAGSVPVTAGGGTCPWTAVSNVPWITVTSGHSGSGSGAVNFSVDPNPGPARTGALRIANITFTVLQSGAACSYSVSPATANYTVAAAKGMFSVNAAAGCGWSVLNNNPEFITITGGSTGSGNGPVAYTVALNTSQASRIGTISIVDGSGLAAASLTITQAGLTSAFQYAISTVAGSGSTTYSGDYGPATLAGMAPISLARDAAGNLFIADRASPNGSRIRKVSRSGNISTVAGGGATDPYHVGGVAINDGLYNPYGVAVDNVGNVYCTHDNGGAAVFKVDTSGMLTLFVGGNSDNFSGDGGPAAAAQLNTPAGLATDAAGNLYIVDAGNQRIRKVNTSGTITTVAGNGSSTSSGDGGAATQAGLNNPIATAADAAGNIYIADGFGQRVRKVDTSGTITTFAGTGQAGYTGDGGPAASAQLNFPSGVAVDPGGRVFIADRNNNVIRMVDTSGVITTIAGNQSRAGFAGDGGPATSAQLSAPTFLVVAPDGKISFVDSSNNRIRQLTPTVPASAPVAGIVLTQSGFTFQAIQGGGSPSPESFQILNATANTITFTLTPSTVSGGPSWLSVSPQSGSIAPGQAAAIAVSVDPTQISPATPRDYYGQIQVDAPGVPNAPQSLSVVLNLLPSTATQPPLVEPTGLVFLGSAGGGNPAPQSIRITDLTSHTSTFSGTITVSGVSGQQSLFTVSPVSGSVAPNQPATVQLNANLSGLSAGVYRGTLSLQFQPDSATESVALVLVVAPPGSAAGSGGTNPRAPCTPTTLVPTLTLLGANFSTLAGWPANIQAVVVDDCANYIDSGTVTATFSNNDPQLALRDSGGHIGRWSVTWAAQHALASGLTVTVSAQANGLSGSTSVTGGALANPNVPLVFTNGTVSAGSYSPSATPSPGELVSIFGAQLADGTESAPSLPLATSMQNATVTLGGVKLPLVFTSTGQINAQIPYTLPGGVTLPLVVQHADRLSTPQPVTLAAAEPSIFTTNLLGTGQGFVFVVPGPGQQILADPSAPAQAGDVILIYCTGLGLVNPAVTAGQPAPTDALHQATNTVTVTIGGVPVTPAFAGLTPGFTGLYQINSTKMPAGVAPGDQVPVIITVGGVYQSPPVTMAVK
jgi:uncharacterized protein (TIGR03437 family)